MQSLEHHGRAVVEERQHLAGVDQARQRLAGQRRRARERGRRKHRAVLGDPECGGAQRCAGQQVVDVVDGQQALQGVRLGVVDMDV